MKTADSFIDLLDAYGSSHGPLLRYDGKEEFETWRRKFRNAVQTLRGPVPERVPLVVDVVETHEADDHVRHLLRIAVSEFSTLTAYLLVPTGADGGNPRAGLIASHGHVKYGIESISGVRGVDEGDGARRTYALDAVKAGYVVLAPAWWGWPGRDGHLDRVGNRDRCNVIQNAASFYGLNVLDLHIQDGQAAVDALADRAEVDGDRIGCIGNSYGGRTTMWLTVFEDRIKACVPAGCMNTFRERSLKLSCCGIQFLPGILRYGDVPEAFSLIAPRPMQLQVGEGDGLITLEDRDAILETVRSAYGAAGAGENIDYVLHPDGHLLRWDLAEPFLAKHL